MNRRAVLICSLLAFSLRNSSSAKTTKRSRRGPVRRSSPPTQESPKGPPENQALATLKTSLANSGSGFITLSGRWSVCADGTAWCAQAVPLVDAWCAFGPEIREKSARIEARSVAPSGGRIRSRFGVGLYGKNGVQLRTAPSRNEIELVRRGAVLTRVKFDQKGNEALHLELSAAHSDAKWEVAGRVWRDAEDRPQQPLMTQRFYVEELELPFAGQAVLTAAAFSGEAVRFTQAAVFGYPEPAVEKEKI